MGNNESSNEELPDTRIEREEEITWTSEVGGGPGRPIPLLSSSNGEVLTIGTSSTLVPQAHLYWPGSGAWYSVDLSLAPSQVVRAYAVGADGGVVLVVDTIPRTGGNDWLQAQTTWAVFSHERWEVDFVPIPWLGKAVYGVALRGDSLFVVTKELTGVWLWEGRSGNWSGTQIPFFDLGSDPALAINATHVFVAGQDGAGRVVVAHKGEDQATFSMSVLRDSPAFGPALIRAHSPMDGTPTFVWFYLAFDLPGYESTADPWMAVPMDNGWQSSIIVEGRHSIETFAATEGGGILVLIPNGGEDARFQTIWRIEGDTPSRCDIDHDNILRLFGLVAATARDSVELVFRAGGRWATVSLDPTSPTCLASGNDSLPSQPPAG